MTDHEKRIRDFLSGRATMRGLCPEQIAGANDSRLNASDLRALLADLDSKTAALNRIAAWPEGEQVTPEFDEPHAAAIARDVLGVMSDADGAQDAPIPCDVFAGGSLFKKGTPFCELAEHMETEAARLVWAMGHMGMSNDHSRNFTAHVLRVGGMGDIHDCRTFIDAALKGAAP